MKTKYLIYSILDYALTFGGASAVIVYNYISPTNSMGFKLSFTGIILLVLVLLSAKTMFQKKYQETYNTLLKQLAEATNVTTKASISEAISKHKIKNDIYERITLLLPFAVLYIVTWLGEIALSDLRGTVGLILITESAGSVFNVIKKPLAEELNLKKLTKNSKPQIDDKE